MNLLTNIKKDTKKKKKSKGKKFKKKSKCYGIKQPRIIEKI